MVLYSLILLNLLGFFLFQTLAALTLNLLLVFFWIAIFLLLTIKVEFLAISFLIIYLGAIAILFIFGLMVVGIQSKAPPTPLRHWSVIGVFLALGGFVWMSVSDCIADLLAYRVTLIAFCDLCVPGIAVFTPNRIPDTLILGQYLYGDHFLFFWTCGGLLLVAIFGVIAATTPTKSAMLSLNKNV